MNDVVKVLLYDVNSSLFPGLIGIFFVTMLPSRQRICLF